MGFQEGEDRERFVLVIYILKFEFHFYNYMAQFSNHHCNRLICFCFQYVYNQEAYWSYD